MKNNKNKLIFIISIALISIISISFLTISLNKNKYLIYDDYNIKIFCKNEELEIKNKNNFDLDFRIIKDTIKIENVSPKSSKKIILNEGYGDYSFEIRNTNYKLEIILNHNYKDTNN